MSTLILYFIRHKPTGHYLPEPAGRMGRGGSWVEPKSPDDALPRIFVTKRSATNALASWLRDRVHHSCGYDAYACEYYEDTEIEAVVERKRDDMEIMTREFEL